MNKKLWNNKIGQNLSSQTLFHLTGSLDVLKLILKNGFQARYIYEKLPGRKLAYLTKTTCFCNIPLWIIKEHINWYGEYGIGINRPIAREKGLSPILYIHSKSPNFPKGSSKKSKLWFDQFKFTRYLKQVRGKQMFFNEQNEPYYKWKTFYNEREWRYFPKNSETFILNYEKEIDLEEKRNNLNTGDLPYFDIIPEWIEYVIIRDAKELNVIKDVLQTNKFNRYYESLLTKIVTIKQIINDF